jgi:glycerol-3-phosphate dehydrogenase
MASRQAILDGLRTQPEVSVLIAGAGINGAGLFRDLALQGVDVLLVDKGDFCAGASSAPSRLIHGGLRYLENGEFRLVAESLKERNLLLKNAPHYVKPMPTTVPIFSWTSGIVNAALRFLRLSHKTTKRGALIIKIGLTMYDLLARRYRSLPTHRFTGRAKALEERPRLNPGIVCTATYYDAWVTHPERLCLELILDGEALEPKAKALNYVSVSSASGDTVSLRDEVSGETFTVKPRVLVNATGAWIDFTNRAVKRETHFIGGTKGSHLLIDHPELFAATRGQMLYFENTDGRICIFFPFHDKVLAGTTDIPVSDPETARCDEGEVDYILESLRLVFPSIQVDRSQIVYRYCGVRPLPTSDAVTPGQISRDHSFPILPPGNGVHFPIYSLVGGKWTTFRAFAEQVADHLLEHELKRSRVQSTEHLSIGGGSEYPLTLSEREKWLASMQEKTQLSRERLETLLDRYGTQAEQVVFYETAYPDIPLRHHAGFSQREIAFIAECERVVHLDDLVLRRTLLALLGQLNRALLDEIAGIVAASLGWSLEATKAEVERTLKLLEVDHGVQLASL